MQLMRILLHRKICPQSSTAMLVGKLKYKDKTQEKEEDGCKWVKTDSDCMFMCKLIFCCSLKKTKTSIRGIICSSLSAVIVLEM